MNIPEGFGTVTPYLFVRNAAAFGEFLKAAFDGDETLRTEMPDGRIANLQIRIGTVTLMISEATKAYPPMPSSFYLYVENTDTAMQTALAAGASKEMDVADMPYGDRQGGVRDPFGNLWWISQRLVDEPYR